MASEGIKVESAVLGGWPPSSKPVALELIADDTNKFALLKQISKDFEKELKTYTGTKNVTTSSPDTPGQFIFKFEQNKLWFLWLSQSELMWEIYNTLNGLYGWSIKINNEDIAIKVSYDNLEKNISPSTISDLIINTRVWPIRIGDFMNYEIDSSVWSILRKNGDITIRIDADLKDGFTNQWPALQKKIEQRAKSYPFPAGITYKSGWEQADNADLIQTTIIWFFVALFAIYMILVLEFNSFSKPAIIMYSVILWLLWVNIGLYITGNPYSMAVWIGIIAMTGIVVDNAAIILERINDNTAHNIDTFEAIVEACKSRLQPMLLTSMTDFFGLLPIAFQDEFWQWLAFTISFWLFAWACMTLFVIPSLYYIVFTRRNNRYNNNHRWNNKTDNTSMETISI
jgi:multidrug efflux pump subunit AcrB